MLIKHQLMHKKYLLILLTFIILIYLINSPINLISQFYYYIYPMKSIKCYHKKTTNTLLNLNNNLKLSQHNNNGKSIFFHETSCTSYYHNKIIINARQACSIESAAKLNPNYQIYLLYLSPGQFKFNENEQSDRILRTLIKTYKNINLNHIDYENYTKDTPVENLYKEGKVEKSEYAQSHASDVLRYLTLWKFGGIYLDLDVIVIKSLENLPENYAGSESENNVAAGVLNFSPNGIGHNFAEICLNDLKNNFKGYDWGYNGPGVITRLTKQICGVGDKLIKFTEKERNCQGFTIYPPEYFYPIPWWNWTMYFDENSVDDVYDLSKNSYVIHVWNKHSLSTKIPCKAQVPYTLFAQKYCPEVFKECDDFF